MIASVHIQNFQSHPDSKLEFASGVNVIVGSSDSGKTAIIRALRWAVWNKPLGDAFRSDWGGDTQVKVELGKGEFVRRFKGKGGDRYVREEWDPDDPENSPQEMEFKAFGTVPPQEIDDTFNLKELNLQNQIDRPFLLDVSPGEVARYFNRIAKIDQIDSSIQTVEKWVREIRQHISNHETQITEQQANLDSFKYLDKMEAEIEVLEQMQTRRDRKRQDVQTLQNKVQEIGKVEQEIESQILVLRADKVVDNILYLFDQKDSAESEFAAISKVLQDLEHTESQITDYQTRLPSREQVNDLIKMQDLHTLADTSAKDLGQLVHLVRQVRLKLKKRQEELAGLEEIWHDNFPDQCPLCGSGVGSDGGFIVGHALKDQFNAKRGI